MPPVKLEPWLALKGATMRGATRAAALDPWLTNAGADERRAFEFQDRAAGACAGAAALDEADELLLATVIGASGAALKAPDTSPPRAAAPTYEAPSRSPAPTAQINLRVIDSSARQSF